jgi:hypothetical protein
MSLSIPKNDYDLSVFGLLVSVTILTFLMVMYKVTQNGGNNMMVGLVRRLLSPMSSFMREGSRAHIVLYFVLFAAVLASTVLVCVD